MGSATRTNGTPNARETTMRSSERRPSLRGIFFVFCPLIILGQFSNLFVLRTLFRKPVDLQQHPVFAGHFLTTPLNQAKLLSATANVVVKKDRDKPLNTTTDTVDKITDDDLPQWIENYMSWHSEMRTKFPGQELFTNPDAPKLLVRTCLGLCGGLNDRLGQLPWDLYLANQTDRVLLMSWSRPRALENYLIPNKLDWSIPPDVPGWGFNDMPTVRNLPRLFNDMPEANPTDEFATGQVDEAIQRATVGEYKDEKILTHRVLGHILEPNLERRLRALGETDMIHNTLSFGRIFRSFFQPSPGVQTQLDQVRADLNVTPGRYTAVHCRVRHPKARAIGAKTGMPASIDKIGLPFHGEDKDFAVGVATHAIQCARTQLLDKEEPIYFFSDSNDLVRYMVQDLKNQSFLAQNASSFQQVDSDALKAVTPAKLVARNMSMDNVHIDKQKGRQVPEYYPTFVDLYLAMGARCMTYGIGFYAVFAAKLSGISCKLLYQQEVWGGSFGKQDQSEVCTPDNYQHLN